MSRKNNLKKYIEQLVNEVQKEMDEATTTANVDGYNTPYAFSSDDDDERREKTATQLGYSIVNNDVDNITESTINNFKQLQAKIFYLYPSKDIEIHKGGFYGLPKTNDGHIIIEFGGGRYAVVAFGKSSWGNYNTGFVYINGNPTDSYEFSDLSTLRNILKKKLKLTEAGLKGLPANLGNKKLSKLSDTEKLNILNTFGNIISFHVPDWAKSRYDYWQVISAGKIKKSSKSGEYYLPGKGIIKASPAFPTIRELLDGVNWDLMQRAVDESINQNKTCRSCNTVTEVKKSKNRWLELKNDDTHPNKKLAIGLKELKYKLTEIEKFLTWYNKISKINELSSDSYWKRTHNHIYRIKERLVNIAHTIKELEQ